MMSRIKGREAGWSRCARVARPVLLGAVLLCLWATGSGAEELWLYDGSRVYGLVEDISSAKGVTVFLPTTERKVVPLADIISIRFLGRDPLLIQPGTQEFRFVNGGMLRGRFIGYTGNKVDVETDSVGTIALDLAHAAGFVTQPMYGFSSLKAEEMVIEDASDATHWVDVLIDRRGSRIDGVLRRFSRTDVDIDIDDLLQTKSIRIPYLKGVRMADAARVPRKPWAGNTRALIKSRDRSSLIADIEGVRLDDWLLRADWHPEAPLVMPLHEIAEVRVMGGKVQYLSQLEPVSVAEETILAPAQPYAMDRTSQKQALTIGDRQYPWGIGVHANASLTFDIKKRYAEFRSDVGIDSRMGKRGSVVFEVLGDGKTLHTSPVLRGGDPVHPIRVKVAGVERLTLKVTDAGDLDLGDVANWGSARLLKEVTP